MIFIAHPHSRVRACSSEERFAMVDIMRCLLALLLVPRIICAQNFKSLISLSNDISAASSIAHVGNNHLNVIKIGNETNNKPICYIPYLRSFSRDGVPLGPNGYEGLAAVLLALEHLNTGNGSIVSELDGIDKSCPLNFLADSFDDMSRKERALYEVIQWTVSGGISGDQLVPCAILGASRSSISVPTAIVSSLRDYPQISFSATSSQLDDKSQFPQFGRTIPSDDGTAFVLLRLLATWDVRHLAVLHVDDSYGVAFAEAIQLLAPKFSMTVRSVNINVVPNDGAVSIAVNQLKETQFTYVFAVVTRSDTLDRIMIEAHRQRIAGRTGHTWIFSDGASVSSIARCYPKDSPLALSYHGTGMLTATGGVAGLGMRSFDKLSSSLKQLRSSEQDMQFLNDHLPKNTSGEEVDHSIITGDDFLAAIDGAASFVYDAAVALGLAACKLAETSNPSRYDNFTGSKLFQGFTNTTFEGTSGTIVIDQETGSRESLSAYFSLSNFVAKGNCTSHDEAAQGSVQIKVEVTDIFQDEKWSLINSNFLFSDGSNKIPADLPAMRVEYNTINTEWKVLGLILCSIIVGLALGFIAWTYRYRENRVVRSSQPIFLCFIAVGVLLMGSTIIPLSFDGCEDDSKGAVATCMSIPWLMATGFSICFSALFTKTYRINQIMKAAEHFRRLKLTARDVMVPMAVLLLLNVIILIVWTVIDPLRVDTFITLYDFFQRPRKAYCMCTSDHASIFVSALSIINLGSLAFSAFQAWQARNLSTDMAESSYIFRVMAIFLYVSFLGIPIMFLVMDNADAFYFALVGIIFIVCTSTLLFIFLPKILAERNNKKEESNIPKYRWAKAGNNDGGERKDTKSGIGVRNNSARMALEAENRSLKRMVKKLSGSQGGNGADSEDVEHQIIVEEEDSLARENRMLKETVMSLSTTQANAGNLPIVEE